MGQAIVRKCTVAEIETAPNIQALLTEYAAECATSGLPMPSAKFEMYRDMERVGALSVFGAFVDGLLVGLVTVLSHVSPQYSVLITCAESMFVVANARSTGAGLALIHAAENAAFLAGSPGLVVSAKSGSNLENILINLKYTEEGRSFFKRLAA